MEVIKFINGLEKVTLYLKFKMMLGHHLISRFFVIGFVLFLAEILLSSTKIFNPFFVVSQTNVLYILYILDFVPQCWCEIMVIRFSIFELSLFRVIIHSPFFDVPAVPRNSFMFQ